MSYPSIYTVMGRGYDATPSVALIIGSKIYLFNSPPLINRTFNDNRLKQSNISKIFLTSTLPHASSGFLSLIFDSNIKDKAFFDIIGPKDLMSYLCQNQTIIKTTLDGKISSSLSGVEGISANSILMKYSMSYIVKINYSYKSINKDKLNAAGITDAFMIGKIKKKGKITTKDGKVIREEDIYDNTDHDYLILFLDILDNEDFGKLPPNLNMFQCIVHFTSTEMMTPEYFERFPKNVKNYCFFEDAIVALTQSADFYAKKTCKHPNLFPPLSFGHTKAHLPAHFISLSSRDVVNFQNFLPAKVTNEVPIFDCPLPKFRTFAITFAGTNAGFPTPVRNVTGYLMHTNEGFIVIDCGNGFIQQIRRKYGPKNVEFILENLSCIWNSHPHFDHVFGIVDLLLERRKVTDRELLVCCDPEVASEILEKEKLFGHDHFFNVKIVNRENDVTIGKINIRSFPVFHCENSMGCVITFENGKKFGFTGDMLENGSYANNAGKIDYLLSEATYSNKKANKCVVYNHMTIEQAMKIQKNVGAEYLIMTHFSSATHYKDLYTKEKNVIFAFDYLCLTDDKIDQMCEALA